MTEYNISQSLNIILVHRFLDFFFFNQKGINIFTKIKSLIQQLFTILLAIELQKHHLLIHLSWIQDQQDSSKQAGASYAFRFRTSFYIPMQFTCWILGGRSETSTTDDVYQCILALQSICLPICWISTVNIKRMIINM